MSTRERIQRIRTVRRLREIREKVDARTVGEARAAVTLAERRISIIDEDCRRLQTEIAARLAEGTRSTEVVEYHVAWMTRKKVRIAAEAAAAECRERLREAIDAFLLSRIERKRMESWETATAVCMRREEEHAQTVASDEITVLRYGWRKGA
jgi:flagellar biosynthesis chaperone FliJ